MSVDPPRGYPRPQARPVYTGRVNPLGVPVSDPAVGRPRITPPSGAVMLGASPERPQIWACTDENCGAAARTVDHKIPYHPCPAQGGVMVPLVRKGTKATHRLIERPDYVGADAAGVQPVTDTHGRLIMSVETHTDDGYSTTVFAPAATATNDDIHDAKGSAGGH